MGEENGLEKGGEGRIKDESEGRETEESVLHEPQTGGGPGRTPRLRVRGPANRPKRGPLHTGPPPRDQQATESGGAPGRPPVPGGRRGPPP